MLVLVSEKTLKSTKACDRAIEPVDNGLEDCRADSEKLELIEVMFVSFKGLETAEQRQATEKSRYKQWMLVGY